MSQVRETIDQAVRALGQGDHAGAAEQLRRALAVEPACAEAHYWQGVLHWRQDRRDEALVSLDRALAREPRLVSAHNSRGMIFFQLGRLDAAQQAFERALRLAPAMAQLHSNLGLVYREQQLLTKALASFRRAVELDPAYAEARNHLGVALGDLGQIDESIACLERALADAPQFADAANNLGAAYEERAEFARAAACYERAKAITPGHTNAHYNHALLKLRLGEWQDGWTDYEYRFQTPWSVRRDFAVPRWQGEPLRGKTILLWTEQGLGDTIQFARFGRTLQQQGAEVICECQRPLELLLRGCDGFNQVVPRGDALPTFDYHLPLMSLPHVLRLEPSDVPAQVPYLRAPESLIAAWRARLEPTSALRVGIHWRGSPTHRRDFHRSFPFPYVAQLAEMPGVQLYSLQKFDPGSGYQEFCDEFGIWSQPAELDEAQGPFMDTAALMHHLDLVITCDTSIAHLAGALARPVWLALRHVACWRWMQERRDSPWYPTLQLYRQPIRGNWDAVFDRMTQDLAALSNERSQTRLDRNKVRADVTSRCVAASMRARTVHGLAAADRMLSEVLAYSPHDTEALRARESVLADQARLTESTKNLEGQVQQAMQWHREGKIADAAAQYEAVLATQPDHLDALHMGGLAAHQLGQHSLALDRLRRAAERSPRTAAVHNHLGLACQASGLLQEAETCFRRALSLSPDFAEAFTNLGSLYQKRGDTEQARDLYEQALARRPQSVAALYNLGLIARQQHRFADAADLLKRCLELRPEHLEARTFLGECLLHLGEFEQAAEQFENVIARRADVATAWNHLGTARKQLGRLEEAEQHYRRALEIQPDYVEAHYNLGLLCAERGRPDDSVAAYRAALARRPDYLPAQKNLGHALQLLGEIEEAANVYDQALASSSAPSLRFAAATLLPVIYESGDQVHHWRDRFERRVESMIADQVRVDPLRDPVATPFFLAYQGQNDRQLSERLQQVLVADGTYSPPPRRGGGRLRVGFLSKHLREHTIGRLFHGLVARLARDAFWTAALALDPADDAIVRQLRNSVDAYVKLPANLVSARKQILDLDLDVLFYLDIGMAPAATALALSRLARVQCVTWGHPVTTGLASMDYFVSSCYFEAESADEHYTEQLVRLDTINTFYTRPQLSGTARSRSDWGLPEEGTLYICPQSLFKLHPEFDEVIAGILRADPRGHIALLDGSFPHWNELLRKRLAARMADVVGRIHFVPRSAYSAFLHLYAVADVMLDPFPFGGGNTSYEALSFGLPIVTWPTPLLRGRITAGLYKKMGLGELCASSIPEYIERAVTWGRDRDARDEARRAIRETCGVLYEDANAIRATEQFLREAVERGR